MRISLLIKTLQPNQSNPNTEMVFQEKTFGRTACFILTLTGRAKVQSWQTKIIYCCNYILCIECFHMTSRRPYWCPKTMKRRPCWCPKLILWELNSFLMQTLSFVTMNLHRCWSREWKHSIVPAFKSLWLLFVVKLNDGKKIIILFFFPTKHSFEI